VASQTFAGAVAEGRLGSQLAFEDVDGEAASDLLVNELGENVRNAMGQMAETHNNLANMHGESMQRLQETIQSLSAPKRIIRGPDGRAAGVELQT
jgi:hypothetical protein